MANGDYVIPATIPPLTTFPRRPILGRVIGEDAGPTNISVGWFNGKLTEGLEPAAMFKVHPPASELLLLVGKWVQLVRYNNPGLPTSGDAPKSDAAAGLVHMVIGLSDYDGADPVQFLAFMSMMDGRVPWIAVPIDDDGDFGATQLSTHTQRRNIGRD